MMNESPSCALAKVPAVTLGFWVIKILATTLGETAGDTLSMSYDMGYLVSTAIFVVPLLALVSAQIRARQYHPFLYWAAIVASTTAGTTMADFATRSLGIGYPGGALLLAGCVAVSLAAWKAVLGSVSVETVGTPRSEVFYWLTITFSQTLGTAVGDWAADDGGFGYLGGAMLFGGLLLALVVLWKKTRMSPVLLFWSAFILTRPLGATVGDFLDKPFAHGGLDLSRPMASAALGATMIVLILILPQRAGRHVAAA
ncbi:hypothetical protein MTR64_01060 [Novosphingobium sp. 2580]|uniref:Membrane-anchored protein n=2 Tax=Novosphingobium album (ex Hu et al. 2023) TaxID=2930093 RepID=A0ABT0AWC9_9SPHN|nr:hypothetical protein [Novosphingobium album (ex Hu et al. 2023)]MCJ2177143.1 hypothetical protein [Novosphingobium album (ex Hu et al. 2023)]